MTRPTAQPAKPINGMKSGQDSPEAAAVPLEGEYVQRQRRRRLDLRTLHGTLRESARVYRELAEGRISLSESEVRSRVLTRHSQILSSLEQREQLAQLQAAIERIQATAPAELTYTDMDSTAAMNGHDATDTQVQP
jgi:hypothetical protein